MDKEKEIEEMYNVVKCGLDIQFACGDEIEIGDKEAATEIIVEDLQKAGYGNVKQAVKEFAAAILADFEEQKRFYETARILHGDISAIAINYAIKHTKQLFKELYGEGEQ